ncbi:MAG: hypothetical protein IJT96_01190 [Lachnospiraceae bacterium]|nr:hypothetical protein [Lachnospiraceae bacterium]
MVEMFESDLREEGRRSSKGNQLKWEDNGVWYKADYLGYEGLSEYVVSELLKDSTLASDEYVIYYPEQIRYKNQTYNGCRSNDFTGGWQTITLERLFKNLYGEGLNKGIYSIEDHEARLIYLVEQAERATGIKDFGKYVCKLFTIDALFLNEDRHTHNISVLMDGEGGFRLCPIYDNGAALLSDTAMDYPLEGDIYELISSVKSKTICDSFDEQLEIAEKLYGRQITFSFDRKRMEAVLDADGIYDKKIKNRVSDIVLEQRRKYKYLFSTD